MNEDVVCDICGNKYQSKYVNVFNYSQYSLTMCEKILIFLKFLDIKSALHLQYFTSKKCRYPQFRDPYILLILSLNRALRLTLYIFHVFSRYCLTAHKRQVHRKKSPAFCTTCKKTFKSDIFLKVFSLTSNTDLFTFATFRRKVPLDVSC